MRKSPYSSTEILIAEIAKERHDLNPECKRLGQTFLTCPDPKCRKIRDDLDIQYEPQSAVAR